MPIVINVQTSSDLASNLKQRSQDRSVVEIERVERKFGIELKRLHQYTNDPLLKCHFVIELENDNLAVELVDKLLHIKGIEGAYIKPPAESP